MPMVPDNGPYGFEPGVARTKTLTHHETQYLVFTEQTNGRLNFADKAETADGTTLWDREVVVPHYAIPTTTDVDEAMRHGVGLWQIHSPTTAELVREYERPTAEKFAAMRERYAPAWGSVFDTLENFTPMGWFASWGEHWYADPRAPLQYREWGAEVSFDGEHWTNVLTVGTPIYDTLVVERGDPTEL